jgi:hypothetical protein
MIGEGDLGIEILINYSKVPPQSTSTVPLHPGICPFIILRKTNTNITLLIKENKWVLYHSPNHS